MNDTDRSGGHLLPLAFSGVATADSAAPPARIRPRRRGLWITVAAVPILAGLIGGGHLWANLQYDEAAAAFSASASETVSLHRDLERFLRESDGVLDAAELISEADSGLLTTAAVREAFEAAVDDTGARFSDAADAASVPLPRTPEKPVWTWELLAGAGALEEATVATREHTGALDAAGESMELSLQVLDEATENLFDAAADAAEEVEEAHLSALNTDIIDLRLARDHVLAQPSRPDAETADAFAGLDDAASAVVASHEKILTSKAGPLLNRRLQVEEFARSIAGGVLLDFEWDRIVNGRGLGGSAGGLATWNAGHGGFSTITLSNSVAEHWPSAVMRALVAHEVGHAISAKCYEMFDWEDRDANEEWATAWAISQGHTADGNGVSLYGYPRQEIIEKAKTCR